jgi:hydrogenase maturation protease
VSQQAGPLVVIGVGNVLLGDDAAGVRTIEALEAAAQADPGILPPDAQLVDGGTLGLDLLGAVRGSRGLVLVDAVRLGGRIGEVRALDARELDAVGGAPDGGPGAAVCELLATARLMGWLPTAVALVGIEVGDLDVGLHLSPAVTDAIPVAVATVRRELGRMDHLPGNETQGGDPTRPMAGALA